MSKIQGKDFILFAVTNGSPETLTPIGCARSVTLTTAVNIAGISTVGSGKWQEFQALSINWNVSTDGLCTFDENMNINTLREYQFTLTPLLFKMWQLSAETSIEYTGYCIIQNAAETGSYNDVMNYSIQLQGTGELDIAEGVGNPPTLFQIIDIEPDDPEPGFTSLDLVWNAAVPAATGYTMEIVNTTTSAVEYMTGGVGNTFHYVAISADSYTFRIRSNYGIAHSEYTEIIEWP